MPDSLAVFPTSWPYDGGAVPLKVRAHPRARRIALKIDHAGEAVEMVLPRIHGIDEGQAPRGAVRRPFETQEVPAGSDVLA